MNPEKKDLTFLEASSIVAGYGIGGGIMAVPYLASLAGVLPLIGLMLVGYLISIILHLMIVEMMMRDDDSHQIVELLNKYLFRGRFGAFFTWSFFILCIVAFFGTLTTYVVGGGEVFEELLGIPQWAGQLIFYAIAAGVVFFGLKAVGISEKLAIIAIALLVFALTGFSLRLPFSLDPSAVGGVKTALALYGMIMFSFFSFFSVPQAVTGLSWNKRLAPWSVICGMGITFVFVFIITITAMGVSEEVTRIAMIGWGKALGNWALYLGSVFVLLAMLTSFWSISLALSVVLQERLKWNERLAWLAATVPCLLTGLSGFTDFLGFLRLTGGLIAILVAVIMVPAYLACKRLGVVKEPAWTMGRFGNKGAMALVIVGYIMVLVGNVVKFE